ncbi:MAG: hypothetical protein M3O36_00985, partial [Myxococcota bacterium]|nr:hypothetical protein [Myxococcota bacterium]
LWPAPFRADCTVSRPRGGAGVNVALVVRGGAGICGSGRCLVPLDAESTEGWQTSPDGARIELPLAVCANGDVTAVEVATFCPAKQANAAICPGMSPPTTDGGCAADAEGGCPEGYVCEASSGKTECVLFDSGTTDKTRCHADPTLPCAGNAVAYSCNGLPDPSLQCDQIHSACSVSGWCCIPAGDAGTCSVDAGMAGVLIDDMSEQATAFCGAAQIKLSVPPGGGTSGYWFTVDDGTGSGSMFPAPHSSFTYTPVAATCSSPLSNAACMKSVAPYQSGPPNGWALMGFNFDILAPTPDSGTLLTYDVSGYKGIRFWARASDSGSQSVSIQFLDAANHMAVPGAACANVAGPLGCYNFYQETQTFQSTWSQYEVDFDKLTQRFTNAQGFFTTPQFDMHAALGIQFVVDGSPLSFDVCVSQIYFVPK